MKQVFQQRLQSTCAPDALFDFLNLSIREFFPARPNRSIVSQSAQKQFNFTQGKSHIARKADEEYAIERVQGIPPLAAGAMRRGKEPERFVVTDC